MWGLIFMGILLFLFVLGKIVDGNKSKNVKESIGEYNEKLDSIIKNSGITGDVYWSGNDFKKDVTALSINQKNSEIIILKIPKENDMRLDKRKSKVTKVKFEEVIEVKILTNSSTVTSTSRGAQIVGAVVGGALLGGVGAVVGGLSGKTVANESIRKLSLEIVINSVSNPTIEIPFYNASKEVVAGSHKYDELMRDVNKWYRKIGVILQQKD